MESHLKNIQQQKQTLEDELRKAQEHHLTNNIDALDEIKSSILLLDHDIHSMNRIISKQELKLKRNENNNNNQNNNNGILRGHSSSNAPYPHLIDNNNNNNNTINNNNNNNNNGTPEKKPREGKLIVKLNIEFINL